MPKPSEEDAAPRLEWPEHDRGGERDAFYEAVQLRLGPADWVAVVPTPAPLGAVRTAIEAACLHRLQPLELPHDGVAWICPRAELLETLSGLFHARRPELAFLAFDARPNTANVMAALQSADGSPAKRLLLFDDGELVEIQPPNK